MWSGGWRWARKSVGRIHWALRWHQQGHQRTTLEEGDGRRNGTPLPWSRANSSGRHHRRRSNTCETYAVGVAAIKRRWTTKRPLDRSTRQSVLHPLNRFADQTDTVMYRMPCSVPGLERCRVMVVLDVQGPKTLCMLTTCYIDSAHPGNHFFPSCILQGDAG